MRRLTCVLILAASFAAGGMAFGHHASAAGPAAVAQPAPRTTSAPVPVPATPTTKGSQDRFEAATVPGNMEPSVRLWAPVPPPYANSAYRNLGGQPETGQDVLDSQTGHGR